MNGLPSVLVLGGGPGAEREISLASAAGVAGALREAGHEVFEETLGTEMDRAGESIGGWGELGSESRGTRSRGDVVFPVLHGSFGEGGPLQDLLERDGRPFVGSRARAARLSMDKLATKLAAARLGIDTPDAAVLNPEDEVCPLPLPVVVKPVHEGSSVGLMMCHGEQDWVRAHERVRSGGFGSRVPMVERLIEGRELTVGLLADEAGVLRALPVVEIVPADGVYDYEAKYGRDDTAYLVDPDIECGQEITDAALRLADLLGVRHLCRVDFMLDRTGRPWLLEVNTMPGFTPTSLLPKAASHAGIEMAELVSRLVLQAHKEG